MIKFIQNISEYCSWNYFDEDSTSKGEAHGRAAERCRVQGWFRGGGAHPRSAKKNGKLFTRCFKCLPIQMKSVESPSRPLFFYTAPTELRFTRALASTG
jgi:hypothetical protein